MTHKVITILCNEGLCGKNAANFVNVASEFKSNIMIEKGNKKINAKSIMGLLSLSVAKGDSVHIVATGSDEERAIVALESLYSL